MSQEVRTERHDGVLVVTIDRPEARTALNGAAARGLAAACDELDGDDALRVGVPTGAGGAFCSGMDLTGFRVVPTGTALDTALELAARIVANGPLAVAATRRVAAPYWSWEEGWREQDAVMADVFVSEDAQEGARAFAGKRDPVRKGR